MSTPLQIVLTTLIRLADAAYRAGKPLMSDAAFDRLSRLAPDALPPLASLLSLNCPVEPRDWLAANPGPYTVQLKCDGVSVALIYIDGTFTHAHLRSGRDCTPAALRSHIPLELPGKPRGRVEVRCEATALAETQPGYTPGPNAPKSPTRNAVAAALRRKQLADPLQLTFLAFDIDGIDTITTQRGALTWLRCAGFALLDALPATTAAEVLDLFAAFIDLQPHLPLPCDGLVVKLDSKIQQRQLGNDSRAPRWAISLKP